MVRPEFPKHFSDSQSKVCQLGQSELWIHGHAHTSFDCMAKGTKIVCNPRGYVRSEHQ